MSAQIPAAQMNRETKVKLTPHQERLTQLGSTARTQGLSAKEFKEFVDLLQRRFLLETPFCSPGSTDGWGYFRTGQADVVKFIRTNLMGMEL